MIPLKLSDIARYLGCSVPTRDATVDRVTTDSRKVEHGTLFAALPGNHVDGHDYARSAVSLGAVAVLVSRPLKLEVPQLVVEDVLLALGRLATLLRRELDPLVAGITGSNGKTTVKEMVAAVLRLEGGVLATHGNYNNELGVPLTLFELEPRHRFAVLEMGASKAGDIAYLAKIAQPDLGLITNIGPAHLGGFGSEKGVALAKGEMYAALPVGGTAVINADEPWCDLWKDMNTASSVMTFGHEPGADIRLVEQDGVFVIRTPGGEFEPRLQLPGDHNRLNAAAATAVALALGLDLGRISEGLATVKPVPGRLNLLRTPSGWTVIDDTYNANPASLYSALQVLAGMQGKPWLVLGDMKELGEDSRKLHREVGEAARAMGVRRLFTLGDLSRETTEAFGQGARHFSSHEELADELIGSLHAGVICLVKGSRSMGMEAIVQAVTGTAEMREAG